MLKNVLAVVIPPNSSLFADKYIVIGRALELKTVSEGIEGEVDFVTFDS